MRRSADWSCRPTFLTGAGVVSDVACGDSETMNLSSPAVGRTLLSAGRPPASPSKAMADGVDRTLRFTADTPLGRHGLHVGPMAFGAAGIGNLRRSVPDEESRGAVTAAWECGVRYFDVAPHYGLGLAERRLGRGLAGRPRDEFLVSTRSAASRVLAQTRQVRAMTRALMWQPTSSGCATTAATASVGRSRPAWTGWVWTEIDIAFVHDPDDFYREALDSAFPALEELRAEGAITSCRAGMNQSEMLTRFVERTDLDVVMLAVATRCWSRGRSTTCCPPASNAA